MKIQDAVVLITGANRGLGQQLAQAMLAAGARKVIGAVRDPASITTPGVTPLQLDVTSAADIAAAVAAVPDLTILVNNAGIALGGSLLDSDSAGKARAELDTNLFGPMALSAAFAPVLAGNGGGAIVNVLSVLAWISMPGTATYSLSKAAAWNWTNGLRNELRAQGTQVLGAHMGLMDTDMTKGMAVPKAVPAEIASAIVAALQAGAEEVATDATSQHVKAGLSAQPAIYLRPAMG